MACSAGAIADDTNAIVEGRLVDAAGHPAANVELQLSGDEAFQRTRSNRSGHFYFFNVPSGRYWLWPSEGGSVGGGALAQPPCVLNPLLDVRAGLTWNLGAIGYDPNPSSVTCAISQGGVIAPLTSAGTTADLYIVPAP